MESTKNNDYKSKGKKKKCKVFDYYTMKNGCKITCHGMPKKGDIVHLKELIGLNYVITLLNNGESPQKIQSYCLKEGDIEWHHIPLIGANNELFMSKETSDMIIKQITLFYEEMQKKTLNIYVHCSAGVHRTGTVLYTILRLTGETEESAMEAIKQIRYETYINCGSHRIKYAEEFLVQPLIQLLGLPQNE